MNCPTYYIIYLLIEEGILNRKFVLNPGHAKDDSDGGQHGPIRHGASVIKAHHRLNG